MQIHNKKQQPRSRVINLKINPHLNHRPGYKHDLRNQETDAQTQTRPAEKQILPKSTINV